MAYMIFHLKCAELWNNDMDIKKISSVLASEVLYPGCQAIV